VGEKADNVSGHLSIYDINKDKHTLKVTLTIHGRQPDSGKLAKLRAELKYLLKQFDLTVDEFEMQKDNNSMKRIP
jgi:hypothetical protein